MLKDELNILIRKVVRSAFHVFYILPIKKNRILFESYYGKAYSCNPKYISEYLYNADKSKYELIWIFIEPEKYENIEGIKAVKRNSFGHFFYRFTTKIIISNMTDEVYFPKRKQQVVINTWHAGGAYKRVGLSYEPTHSKATEWQDNILRNETSYYLSSSELFTKYNIREAYNYEGEVLETGLPRNDLFFDAEKTALIGQKVRDYFNIQDKVVVLYAPTYRGDFARANAVKEILPYDMVIHAIENKYKKKVVILNRSHYADLNQYGVDNAFVLNATSYPDMQELLAATDVLITDYSSSIWDFALLGRPCVLYVPDYDQYIGDRGTYTAIETWPGKIAKNTSELLKIIEQLTGEECRHQAQEHLRMFNSYEKGQACQLVSEKIKEVTA